MAGVVLGRNKCSIEIVRAVWVLAWMSVPLCILNINSCQNQKFLVLGGQRGVETHASIFSWPKEWLVSPFQSTFYTGNAGWDWSENLVWLFFFQQRSVYAKSYLSCVRTHPTTCIHLLQAVITHIAPTVCVALYIFYIQISPCPQ